VIYIKEFIVLSKIGNSVGFTIPKSKLELLDLNYGDYVEIEIFKEYQGYPSLIITSSLRKYGRSLSVSLNPSLLDVLRLKEGHGIQVDIRKFETGDKSEESIVQKLFEELVFLFVRLYRSKASSSMVFAKTIHSSLEMQKYFGITAKGMASPGRDIDDFSIFFMDSLFKIIPNSAYLSWDYDLTGKYDPPLLTKKSDSDTIKDILNKFFNRLVKYVYREYNIELEFKVNIII